jgi:hypothetical protein
VTEADRVLVHHDPPKEPFVELLHVVLVADPVDLEAAAAAHAVELAVADPVRLDELAELHEQLAREGLVAAQALGLGDEAE